MLLIWDIDILIPCLWKTCFHSECPGCGMTTAFIDLLTLDFVAAFYANPLVFIVLPVLSLYIVKDFRKFKRQSQK